MTSSVDWPDSAIEYAKKRMLRFANSPLEDANFFNGYLELVSSDSGHLDLDDVVPTLLDKAKKDKLAFITLKRICARYESQNLKKPTELSVWLSNMLRDVEVEPKGGRTGPNKSQTEHLFLLGMSAKIAEAYQKPIYPSHSTGEAGSVLQIIALASKEVKKELGRMIFPTTEEAMKKRYLRARKLLMIKQR